MSEANKDEEEEQAKMITRVITENNVKKIQDALEKNKTRGRGFVLTSQPSQRRGSPKANYIKVNQQHQKRSSTPQLPMVVGSPIGSPPLSRKSTPSLVRERHNTKPQGKKAANPVYLTEVQKIGKVDMAIQSDDVDRDRIFPRPPPVTPERGSENGEKSFNKFSELAPQTDNTRDETAGGTGYLSGVTHTSERLMENLSSIENEREKNETFTEKESLTSFLKRQRRISSATFARLGLKTRPEQLTMTPQLPAAIQVKDKTTLEPRASNVYITRVAKAGGQVKTPFYIQVDIPDGALHGDVIMKFETCGYEDAKLNLQEDDMLCSSVIDIAFYPTAYNLRKPVTVRMRILEECINSHEEVIVVTSRHCSWRREATYIETKEVNGKVHYYAVADMQCTGKLAVITSQRTERFVVTSAGGLFTSTILRDVTIYMEKRPLTELAQLLEMRVIKCKDKAVSNTSQQINRVAGVQGRLIAASPLIEVTKHAMGRSGLLEDGLALPVPVRLTVPLNARVPAKQNGTYGRVFIKVMTRLSDKLRNKGIALPWRDDTTNHQDLTNLIGIPDDGVVVTIRMPCDVLLLAFDASSELDSNVQKESNLHVLCDAILLNNRIYDGVVMVHQKIKQPHIISVHVVPQHASPLIDREMKSSGEWRTAGVDYMSKVMMIRERDLVHVRFREGLRLTVNQPEPVMQFNCRRWQGYQYQLEAAEESRSSEQATVQGTIEFHVQSGLEAKLALHTCTIQVKQDWAVPFKSATIIRPSPKVVIVREYKQKWMKNLSQAERDKYKAINSS